MPVIPVAPDSHAPEGRSPGEPANLGVALQHHSGSLERRPSSSSSDGTDEPDAPQGPTTSPMVGSPTEVIPSPSPDDSESEPGAPQGPWNLARTRSDGSLGSLSYSGHGASHRRRITSADDVWARFEAGILPVPPARGLVRLRSILRAPVPPRPTQWRDPEGDILAVKDMQRQYIESTDFNHQALERVSQALRHYHRKEPWVHLMPEGALRSWGSVIIEDLDIPEHGLRDLMYLSTRVPWNIPCKCVANRIMFHMMEDSSSSSSRFWKNPGKWVHNACQEANEALDNWQAWDAPHNKRAAKECLWDHDHKKFIWSYPYGSYTSFQIGGGQGSGGDFQGRQGLR